MTEFVTLQGAPRKAQEIKKLVPPWMETRYPSLLGAILHAIGIEDHRVTVGDRTLFIRGANPPGNVLYTAKADDSSIRVKHLLPAVSPSALSVSVTGKDILVTLATDSIGAILTTATQLKTAILASTDASALVTLTTFGSANDTVGSTREFGPLDPDGLEGARRDILTSYARGDDLAIIANNYGISKPFLLALTDAQFRQYIIALAFQKKCNRRIIESLLTIIFGPKSTAGWSVYESIRRRTITIEVTEASLGTGPAHGTFLRTPGSKVSTADYTGDYLRSNATEDFVPKVSIWPGALPVPPPDAPFSYPPGVFWLDPPPTGTLPHGFYSYRITAMRGGVESQPSAELTTLTGGVFLQHVVNVTWNPQPDVDGFNVYGRTTGAEQFMVYVPNPATSWLDDGSVTPSGPLPGPYVPPLPAAPSNVYNNSVYARMRGASRPVLLDVMKLARAAGVQVEFRQRRD